MLQSVRAMEGFKLKNRKAVERDIGAIWPRLAKRTTDEFQLADYPSRKARKMFKDLIKAGTAHTILEGTNRIAIIAWEMRGGEMFTSFAGTEAFFEARFVRPSARYIATLQQTNGNCPLVSCSYSTHPQVDRWFAILGFSLRPQSRINHKEFVLKPQ